MAQSKLARAVSPPARPNDTPAPPARSPVKKPDSRPSRVDVRSQGRRLPVAILTIALLAINAVGAPYYLADKAARVRDPLHALLKPSGTVGQSAGVAAFLIFIFLWLYPLRKRWKALSFTGGIGKWLDVHVTSALVLPPLLMIHAAWRADGVIGLGFVSMMIVWASGIVGRYLYTRIPRARSGMELTRDEVATQRKELIDDIARTTGIPQEQVEATLDVTPPSAAHDGVLGVLSALLANDITRWRMTRELGRRWKALAPAKHPLTTRRLKECVRLASREIELTQQARMLDATQKVFKWWHVAHRPFAMTALVAVVIHVAVVVALGATWFY
jgi:hypothetical protein